MKQFINTLLLLFLTTSPLAFSNTLSEIDIVGTWVNQAGDGLVDITEINEIYTGTISGSTDNKDRMDHHNPDPKLRHRSLLNVVVLGDFKYIGDLQWQDGWVYDPNNGKTYSCKMQLIDSQTLEIRGYIGISLFGRTETWTKR
jgi:uncharacterized protein (DUF2147 family)